MIAHSLKLSHQQDRALRSRQRADILDQASERLVALEDERRVVRGRGSAERRALLALDLGRQLDRAAQLVDAPVVRDPVEPRA